MIEDQKSESHTQKKGDMGVEIQSMRKRMFRILFSSLATMGIISLFLILEFASGAFELAYFLGALVGVANGIIGFMTIDRFIDKSNLAFLKGVFLGMGIRMLLLIGIFVLFIKVFSIHVIGLVTGLLIFYFAMTIFEVAFLNKRIEIKKTVKA